MNSQAMTEDRAVVAMKELAAFRSLCEAKLKLSSADNSYKAEFYRSEVARNKSLILPERTALFEAYEMDYKKRTMSDKIFVVCFIGLLSSFSVIFISSFLGMIASMAEMTLYSLSEQSEVLFTGIFSPLLFILAFFAIFTIFFYGKNKKLHTSFEDKWYPYQNNISFRVVDGKYEVDLVKKI